MLCVYTIALSCLIAFLQSLIMEKRKEKQPKNPNKSSKVSRISDFELSSDLPIHVQHKREILEVAESKSDDHCTPLVKRLLVLAILVFLLLTWLVCYFIHVTLTHDANMENKILSGKPMESLRALKQQNFEILIVVFALIFVLFIFVVLIGSAYFVFYHQTSMQKQRRMNRFLTKASEVIDIQECKLSAKLQADISAIDRLENTIKECEMQIHKHRQAEDRNEEKIRRLEDEKADKVTELKEANEELEELQEELEETRKLQKNLKDGIEKEAQLKWEVQQELVNEKARTMKLEADLTSEANRLKTALSKEQSQASSLRSRISNLEALCSRNAKLEAENQRLQERLWKKSSWFW